MIRHVGTCLEVKTKKLLNNKKPPFKAVSFVWGVGSAPFGEMPAGVFGHIRISLCMGGDGGRSFSYSVMLFQ